MARTQDRLTQTKLPLAALVRLSPTRCRSDTLGNGPASRCGWGRLRRQRLSESI
jgi:hypothetical protein